MANNCKSIAAKLRKILSDLRRVGSKLSVKAKLKLSIGLLISKLMYASTVWRVGEGSKKKLQTIINKAARWMLQKGTRTSTRELMSECGWLSVHQMTQFTGLTEMWKTIHKG